MLDIVELKPEDVNIIRDGVVPVAVFAAFVSGATWGAGISVAVLALKEK
jgi:hypothetical protein